MPKSGPHYGRLEIKLAHDFLFVFNRIYASILYRFRDTASYLSKFDDFTLLHLHLAPPLGVTPFECRKDFCHQKTRVLRLSCGVVCMILCVAVLIQYQLVTDRHTHRHTERQTHTHGHGIYCECTSKAKDNMTKIKKNLDPVVAILYNVQPGNGLGFFLWLQNCYRSTAAQSVEIKRLTLTETNRWTAARLALAVGSLHGATVVSGLRMGESNAGVTVGKALEGFTGEILEIFNCPVTCYMHSVMTD